jgi:hypothetical protein
MDAKPTRHLRVVTAARSDLEDDAAPSHQSLLTGLARRDPLKATLLPLRQSDGARLWSCHGSDFLAMVDWTLANVNGGREAIVGAMVGRETGQGLAVSN